MIRAESDFLVGIRQAAEMSDLAARDSTNDGELLRASAAGVRRAAIKLFLLAASDDDISRQSHEIESQIAAMAAEDGIAAMQTLCDLLRASFSFSTAIPQRSAISAWMLSRATAEIHAECWSALTSIFTSTSRAIEYLLLNCAPDSLQKASASFREGSFQFLTPYARSSSTDADRALELLSSLQSSPDRSSAMGSAIENPTGAREFKLPPPIKPAGGPPSATVEQRRGLPAKLIEVDESQQEDWAVD